MTIWTTKFIQPARQKSTDHREGRRRQPDAAEIPGHALCLDIPAEHGRNGLVVRMDGIFCRSPQKEKTDQVDRDCSADTAELG